MTSSCRHAALARRAFRLLAIGAAWAGAMVPVASVAQVPVDRMTCAAAIRAAQQMGSYWKTTGFGVVSIRPGRIIGAGPASCPARLNASFFVERTLDNSACVLGYSCVERVRLRF